MDIWQQLFACLAINHNFNTHVKSDDVIWKGWISALQPHEHLIPNLIDAINSGKLADHLTSKRKAKIDLQDVKTLLKSFLRNQNLDATTKRLAFEQKNAMSPIDVRNMLDRTKKLATKQIESTKSLAQITRQRFPDMPVNKYFKDE